MDGGSVAFQADDFGMQTTHSVSITAQTYNINNTAVNVSNQNRSFATYILSKPETFYLTADLSYSYSPDLTAPYPDAHVSHSFGVVINGKGTFFSTLYPTKEDRSGTKAFSKVLQLTPGQYKIEFTTGSVVSGSVAGGSLSANATLTGSFAPPVCSPQDVLNDPNSFIAGPNPFEPETMVAKFSPVCDGFPLKLDDFADVLGVNHFNWHQMVVTDPTGPDNVVDPPINSVRGNGSATDEFPYYWDENTPAGGDMKFHRIDGGWTSSTELKFEDIPKDPNRPPNSPTVFLTTLAGVPANPADDWKPLKHFRWQSDYNGSTGGVKDLQTIDEATEPGTGGATLIAILNPRELSQTEIAALIADGADPSSFIPEPATFHLMALFLTCLGRQRRGQAPKPTRYPAD